MNYDFKFNRGETFRREIQWKDSANTNLFTTVSGVVIETLEAGKTNRVSTPMAVEEDKAYMLFSASETAVMKNRKYWIYANLISGDKVLILKGGLEADE